MALKLNLNLDKIKSDILASQSKTKTFEKDTRFWKHTADKNGTATVILRLLPDPNMELWAKYYTHSFSYMKDGQKKWWIRNCINTFGYDKECPICKKNNEYWNSSFESDKKIAGDRKRKEVYTANVLIIKNTNKPEDEGKVFLWNFGKKLYAKIVRHIVPTAQDLEDPDFKEFNPFHPLEGATFKLKVKPQGTPPNVFPNYDDSEFSVPAPLFDGDEKKIAKVMKECHDLAEFTDVKNFPTNEEVVTKLGELLGITKASRKQAPVEEDTFEPEDIDEPTPSLLNEDEPEASVDSDDETEDGDADEDLEFFKSLK